MKYAKIAVGILFVLVLVKGLLFISSEENSIRLNTDWGIAKDHPIK
jgi:hypothetical protein